MDDTISRQNAISAVKRLSLGETDALRLTLRIEDYLDRMPSAQPKPKEGKWIPYDIPWYKCSECGAVREHLTFLEYYCPNCGANMRGE